MTAGCEVPLANGRVCGVAAIGRCSKDERAFCQTHKMGDLCRTCWQHWQDKGCEVLVEGQVCGTHDVRGRCDKCRRSFCGKHQAQVWVPGSLLTSPYWQALSNECKPCNNAPAEAAKAEEEKKKLEVANAAARVPGLIAKFQARPFVGAVSRDYTQRVNDGYTFFSQTPKFKTVTHHYEPAVPLGQLLWDYWAMYDAGYDWREGTSSWETGLTQAGEFVPMDPRILDRKRDFTIAKGQEPKICEHLERIIGSR